jgi:hypothetical protein
LQKSVTSVVDRVYPSIGRAVQPSRCNHSVNMGIEFQLSVEGVENRHNADAQTGSDVQANLNDPRSQSGKSLRQMGVVLEQRPKHIRHGECNPLVGNVRQGSPSLALPLYSGAVSATRTRSRFARVATDLLLGVRSKDFRTQFQGSTLQRFGECGTNRGSGLIPVPVGTGLNYQLFEWFLSCHVAATPFENLFCLTAR